MGLDVVPVPAPKALGTLCGIALRIPPEQQERAKRYLLNAQITVVASSDIQDL